MKYTVAASARFVGVDADRSASASPRVSPCRTQSNTGAGSSISSPVRGPASSISRHRIWTAFLIHSGGRRSLGYGWPFPGSPCRWLAGAPGNVSKRSRSLRAKSAQARSTCQTSVSTPSTTVTHDSSGGLGGSALSLRTTVSNQASAWPGPMRSNSCRKCSASVGTRQTLRGNVQLGAAPGRRGPPGKVHRLGARDGLGRCAQSYSPSPGAPPERRRVLALPLGG